MRYVLDNKDGNAYPNEAFIRHLRGDKAKLFVLSFRKPQSSSALKYSPSSVLGAWLGVKNGLVLAFKALKYHFCFITKLIT